MKDNVANRNEELDLFEIIRILLSKVKMLACIALIAAIVGGAFGGIMTLLGREYGTQVEFYITPFPANSTVLRLLSSERFAEKLLLDENGLPENSSGAEYDAALAAKLEYNAAAKALAEAKKVALEAPRALEVAEKNYEEKQKAYDDTYNLLSTYKSATSDKIAEDPEHVQKMKQYEADLEVAKTEKKAAEEQYYLASQNALLATHNLDAAKDAAANAKRKADDLAEAILGPWREENKNKEKISLINESLSYKYVDLAESNRTVNQQFLVVSIAVDNDEELAKLLLSNLQDRLPTFVEENLENPDNASETVCTLISTAAEVEDLSKDSLFKEIIKFAVIFLFLALVVACALVVWTEMNKAALCPKKNDVVDTSVEEQEA